MGSKLANENWEVTFARLDPIAAKELVVTVSPAEGTYTMKRLRLILRLILTVDDDDYVLDQQVKRRWGREPIAGERICIGDYQHIVNAEVKSVTWSPDYCTIDLKLIEPDNRDLPASLPKDTVDRFHFLIAVGFRDTITGYPPGVVDPDAI